MATGTMTAHEVIPDAMSLPNQARGYFGSHSVMGTYRASTWRAVGRGLAAVSDDVITSDGISDAGRPERLAVQRLKQLAQLRSSGVLTNEVGKTRQDPSVGPKLA